MKIILEHPGLFVVILGTFFCSCAAVHVTESFRAPRNTVPGTAGNEVHIMLKTTVEHMPMMQRLQFQMGRQLASMGYIATSCLQLNSMCDDTIYLQKSGENKKGLLFIIEPAQQQQDSFWFQVDSFSPPEPPGNDYYIGYVLDLSDRIFKMQRYMTDTRYTWHSRVYDISTQQLIYSFTAIIENPLSTGIMVRAYSKFMIRDMVDKQLLQSHYVYKRLPF